MADERKRKVNEYDMSTDSYAEWKAQQGNDERMRRVNEYDVSKMRTRNGRLSREGLRTSGWSVQLPRNR